MEVGCACLICWGATCLGWGCWRCCCGSRSAASSGGEWEEVTDEDDVAAIPRLCRIILAVYEKDIEKPIYADRLDARCVVKRVGYSDTKGTSPPYIIYVDHSAKDVCLAIRGLHLITYGDYFTMMTRNIGEEFLDGGYVHAGLLLAARWIVDRESETLNSLALLHPDYTITLAGHSLGSGVVSLMAILLRRQIEQGQSRISECNLRCYAFAPARSMSLNLAVRHADVIRSVVLQDDFLPRTSVPIQSLLNIACCLPCFLTFKFAGDLLTSPDKKLTDRRRLYVPGTLYHVLYKPDFSCSSFEVPVVMTAVPLHHRFERVVFSHTMVDDHSIVNIESKVSLALEALVEKSERDVEMRGPAPQSMEIERHSSAKVADIEVEMHIHNTLTPALTLETAQEAGKLQNPIAKCPAPPHGPVQPPSDERLGKPIQLLPS